MCLTRDRQIDHQLLISPDKTASTFPNVSVDIQDFKGFANMQCRHYAL